MVVIGQRYAERQRSIEAEEAAVAELQARKDEPLREGQLARDERYRGSSLLGQVTLSCVGLIGSRL